MHRAKRVYFDQNGKPELKHYEYRGYRIERGFARQGYWGAWIVRGPETIPGGYCTDTVKDAKRFVDRLLDEIKEAA